LAKRAGCAGEQMSDSQVSVGAALSYAWNLWRGHWRQIWGVLALNALACTVVYAGLFSDNAELVLAGGVSLLFTTFAAYGAMFRLAFAADHPDDPQFRLGSLGLQWGRMELRMLGAQLLLMIFLFILLLLLVILVLTPAMAVMMSKGGPLPATMTEAQLKQMLGANGVTALQLGLAAVQVVLFLVYIRLSLYLSATAESGRISVLRTWKLTRGNFWRIFAATVILYLPTATIISVGGAPSDGQAAALPPGEIFLYSLICGGWAGAAAAPLAAAVQAYFYRNLKPLS
jgi:hypothetical protein